MFFNILIISCIDLQLEDGFVKEFENVEKDLDEKINWDVHILKYLTYILK